MARVDRGGGREGKKSLRKNKQLVYAKAQDLLKPKTILEDRPKYSPAPPPLTATVAFGKSFIDSGCNLISRQFDRDSNAVVRRAGESGVCAIITINTDFTRVDDVYNQAKLFEGSVYCCVGVSPNTIKQAHDKVFEARMTKLLELSLKPETVAIICGLDLTREVGTHYAQEKLLDSQLQMAAQLALPAIVFVKECEDRVVEKVLEQRSSLPTFPESGRFAGEAGGNREHPGQALVVAINGFAGDHTQLDKLLKAGCYIVVTGLIADARSKREVRIAAAESERLEAAAKKAADARRAKAKQRAAMAAAGNANTSTEKDGNDGKSDSTAPAENQEGEKEEGPIELAREEDDDEIIGPGAPLYMLIKQGILPVNRILVSSNAPLDTPQNIEDAYIRSGRNEPGTLHYVASAIARAAGQSLEETSETLFQTAKSFFQLREKHEAVIDPNAKENDDEDEDDGDDDDDDEDGGEEDKEKDEKQQVQGKKNKEEKSSDKTDQKNNKNKVGKSPDKGKDKDKEKDKGKSKGQSDDDDEDDNGKKPNNKAKKNQKKGGKGGDQVSEDEADNKKNSKAKKNQNKGKGRGSDDDDEDDKNKKSRNVKKNRSKTKDSDEDSDDEKDKRTSKNNKKPQNKKGKGKESDDEEEEEEENNNKSKGKKQGSSNTKATKGKAKNDIGSDDEDKSEEENKKPQPQKKGQQKGKQQQKKKDDSGSEEEDKKSEDEEAKPKKKGEEKKQPQQQQKPKQKPKARKQKLSDDDDNNKDLLKVESESDEEEKKKTVGKQKGGKKGKGKKDEEVKKEQGKQGNDDDDDEDDGKEKKDDDESRSAKSSLFEGGQVVGSGGVVKYTCKACRRPLFTSADEVPHVRGMGGGAGKGKGKGKGGKGQDQEDEATSCGLIFVRDVPWAAQSIEGRLDCPKCAKKLGRLSMVSEKCTCGGECALPPNSPILFVFLLKSVDVNAGTAIVGPREIPASVFEQQEADQREAEEREKAAKKEEAARRENKRQQRMQFEDQRGNFTNFRNKGGPRKKKDKDEDEDE